MPPGEATLAPTNGNNQNKLLLLLVLIILGVSIAWAAATQIFVDDIGYDQSSYSLDEWLINYAGGFIRRGLAGEIIWRITSAFHIRPDAQIILLSLSSLFALIFLLLLHSSKVAEAPFLLSAYVLAGPVMDGDIIRKDIIGLLSLALCLFLLNSKKVGSLSRNRRLALANCICTLSLLNHEAFGFFALPIILVENFAHNHDEFPKSTKTSVALRSLAQYAPSLLTLLLVLSFRGNQLVANQIHLSWAEHRDLFIPSVHLKETTAFLDSAIGAIGWGTDTFLEQINETITGFSGPIWIPLAWLATAILGFILFKHFVAEKVHL